MEMTGCSFTETEAAGTGTFQMLLIRKEGSYGR